ncbi:MAG: DUF4402 domain-containing protein [Novosphingobium sp.]|uniref:DUF4402 domain-containing protein n=1 Tax=Novosphingobium sp. TaxID=1874826 RepID=UPI0032B96502
MVRAAFLVLTALLLTAPAGAQQCRLCYSDPAAKPGDPPLGIEIFADLNFSKLALTGREGGSAELSATGGGKSTSGEMIDLGGVSVAGHGRITGIPGREVRVDLPDRVEMTSADGGRAELVGFTTDLPPHPVLNARGELEFKFGARLVVHTGRGGNLRGRIPISVDYN